MNEEVRILQDSKLVKFDKNLSFLWKFSINKYTSLKTLETDLEICFVKHILDAFMKRAPAGFLSILRIQYNIGSVSFSAILKLKLRWCRARDYLDHKFQWQQEGFNCEFLAYEVDLQFKSSCGAWNLWFK